jgi:hypothetical protein
MAKRARDGLKFEPTGKEKGPDPKARLTKPQARAKILGYMGKSLKHPALVDAAVDAAFDGFLSTETVRALVSAGYKPSEVARTLGVSTSAQVAPSPHHKGSGAPGSGRPS